MDHRAEYLHNQAFSLIWLVFIFQEHLVSKKNNNRPLDYNPTMDYSVKYIKFALRCQETLGMLCPVVLKICLISAAACCRSFSQLHVFATADLSALALGN